MTPESPLIRLAKSDIPRAVDMLSRVFADDPLTRRLLADAHGGQTDFARLAKCVLRYGVARGETVAVSPNLEGVAAWFPPSRVVPSLWDMTRFGMILLPLSLRWKSSRLLMAYHKNFDALRAQFLRGPHWYFQLLGVDPAHQGKGYAGLLLRTMLERLDRQRTPCFLDTMNERNVAIYEHFGFHVLHQGEIPGCDCTGWFMARG